MKIYILNGETGKYPSDSASWVYPKAFNNLVDAQYTLALFQRKLDQMDKDKIPWPDRQELMLKHDANFLALDGCVGYSIQELELV